MIGGADIRCRRSCMAAVIDRFTLLGCANFFTAAGDEPERA